jgi:rod shape determining protein RodA
MRSKNISKLKRHARAIDWFLLAPAILISVAGLMVLYSISSQAGNFLLFEKQLLFLVAGIAVVYFFSFFDFRVFKNYSGAVLALYFIGLVLLVMLLFLGYRVKGNAGWFRVGYFGFESAEFVKLALIILLAKYFSVRHAESYNFSHIIISGMYAALPVGLVLLQPDFGSAFTIGLIWLGMILFSGIKLRHLLVLVLIAAIIFSFAWGFLFKTYQKERILSFFDPQFDPEGASYNILQSMAAISTGGFWGKGFMQGTQGRLGFLPEAETDFIFAAFVEEFGIAGALTIFALLMYFIWRVLKIGQQASNNFARLFCSGFAIFIMVHIFINIGMNLNLFPVVGIPLPFMSYGGSNLMTIFFGVSIVESIYINTKHKGIESEEYTVTTVKV